MSAAPKVIPIYTSSYADTDRENLPVRRAASSHALLGSVAAALIVGIVTFVVLNKRSRKTTPRPNRTDATPQPDADRARREQQRLIDESRKVIDKTRRIERENGVTHGR